MPSLETLYCEHHVPGSIYILAEILFWLCVEGELYIIIHVYKIYA